MTERPSWKALLGQWFIACVLAQLLQIWGDGFMSWIFPVLGAGGVAEGISPVLFGLTLLRLVSSALGGAVQWFVLRPWLSSLRGWVLATSFGSAIALVLVNSLWSVTLMPPSEGVIGMMMPLTSMLPKYVFSGITGIILGAAQWVILRRKISHAGWWVLLSGLGLLAGEILVAEAQSVLGPTGIDVSQNAWNPSFWVISSLSTVIYAAITGFFLVRCLGVQRERV